MLTFLRSPNCLHIFDATVETLPMFASSSLDFIDGYYRKLRIYHMNNFTNYINTTLNMMRILNMIRPLQQT